MNVASMRQRKLPYRAGTPDRIHLALEVRTVIAALREKARRSKKRERELYRARAEQLEKRYRLGLTTTWWLTQAKSLLSA